MTEFRPGTSPPPVRMPMRFLAMTALSALRELLVSPRVFSHRAGRGGRARGTVRNCPQPDERGSGVYDDARGNRLEVRSKTPFVLESRPEFRSRHKVRDARSDSPCDVDAASRTKRQSDISGDRSEHRAKQLERYPRGRAVTQCRLGNLGGITLWGLNAVDSDDSAVEVLQSGSRNHSLRRHVSELTAQIVDDRVFAAVGSGHSRVTALACNDNRPIGAGDQAGDA